jgi:hypothetical protein
MMGQFGQAYGGRNSQNPRERMDQEQHSQTGDNDSDGNFQN